MKGISSGLAMGTNVAKARDGTTQWRSFRLRRPGFLQNLSNKPMRLPYSKFLAGLAVAGALTLGGPTARANLTIQFNYDFDDTNFVSGANIGRRAILEQAASVFTTFITDSLDLINPSGGNSWVAQPFDPRNTGASLSISNLVVPANTLIVYVGASNLGASTLGEGGAGGYFASGSQAWLDTTGGRGQAGALLSTPTDYGPWGGTLAFNNTKTWYFDSDPSTVETFTGQNDFYSVAVHEIGHLLGFAHLLYEDLTPVNSWSAQTNSVSAVFSGAHAMALNGGVGLPVSGDLSHWAANTMSTVVGTGAAQEAAMDPTLTVGTRKFFTVLDYAGLQDIGWQLVAIPEPATLVWAAALGAAAVLWRRRAQRG
jgi:hypothetical protein